MVSVAQTVCRASGRTICFYRPMKRYFLTFNVSVNQITPCWILQVLHNLLRVHNDGRVHGLTLITLVKAFTNNVN